MAFDEIRFPTAISRGASGGPERRTEIVVMGSGREERNSRWADSRRTYNAGFSVKSLDDLHAMLRFFEERRGRLHGFRWKDHTDFKSCPPQQPVSNADQTLGVGDGVTASFQLVKRYGSGLRDYMRTIAKPVAGSVRLALNGVEQMSGWSADTTTGNVTFTTAPGAGVAITAGFEFDVPVRFDTDMLDVTLDLERLGSITSIPLLEIRR